MCLAGSRDTVEGLTPRTPASSFWDSPSSSAARPTARVSTPAGEADRAGRAGDGRRSII